MYTAAQNFTFANGLDEAYTTEFSTTTGNGCSVNPLTVLCRQMLPGWTGRHCLTSAIDHTKQCQLRAHIIGGLDGFFKKCEPHCMRCVYDTRAIETAIKCRNGHRAVAGIAKDSVWVINKLGCRYGKKLKTAARG